MQEVEFVGSRKSQAALTRRMIWLGLAAGLAFSLVRTGFRTPVFVAWGAIAAVFALLDWAVMRRMRAGSRVALLDEAGIASPLFSTRAERYAWEEIAGASVTAPQGHRALELLLKPRPGLRDKRAFWNGINAARPQIPLAALAAADQERLLQAVLERIGQAPAEGELHPSLQDLRQERVFQEQLQALAPTPWLTWTLVGLNVALWLAMLAVGVNGMHADARTLLDWGGNSSYQVVAHHEAWRLLTAAFLHGGFVHLAMNMVGLASAGPAVERLYGRWQFALIYFGAALAGNALSLHFAADRAVSVGASGAVFGVFGAMLVGLHGHRKDLPRAFNKRSLGGLGFFIAYSLLQGFARSGVDNAAHVGGLLGGAALAWLLPRQLQAQRFARLFPSRAWIGTVLVAVAVGGMVVRAGPGVDQRGFFTSLDALDQGLRLAETAQRELARDQAAAKKGELSELALDERSRTIHAPNFRRSREQLERVKLPPGDPRAAFVAAALRVSQGLEEMLAMESKVVDGKAVPVDPERFAAAERETFEAAKRMRSELEQLKQASPRAK